MTTSRSGGRICCGILIFLAALTVAAPAATASVTYQYDALGRIRVATYDNGVVITYSYDAAGNRTSQVVTGAAGGTTWGNFNWGSANWGH